MSDGSEDDYVEPGDDCLCEDAQIDLIEGRGRCPRCTRAWWLTDAEIKAERALLDRMTLTPRQDQIARLAASGLSNKQIARDLGITEGTVKAHMQNIFNRIGTRSRTVLAAQWRELARPA
jgi:DNA-binding NarL/FixJ family response regulator